MNKLKKMALWGIVFVLGFLMVFSKPAFALSDWLMEKYSDYQVYFYNAEQKNCIPKDGGDPSDPENPGSGEWDGHCSNISAYIPKIEQYFDYIYSVAQNNGLPWEGIVGQLIGESGFMSREVCSFNPLGLKGSPSCDGKHRSFNSYEEAFNYYVNSIRPVREAMGKFKNDPYGYIVFLIHGVPGYKYATDPEYINKISGHVCGVQKWAKNMVSQFREMLHLTLVVARVQRRLVVMMHRCHIVMRMMKVVRAMSRVTIRI